MAQAHLTIWQHTLKTFPQTNSLLFLFLEHIENNALCMVPWGESKKQPTAGDNWATTLENRGPAWLPQELQGSPIAHTPATHL